MKTLGRFSLYVLGLTISLFTLSCQNGNSTSSNLGNTSNGSSGVVQNRTTLIQATASVGVTKVEFYVNNNLTCTILSPPYNCSWNVPPGAGISYQLQTKAYDAQGKVGLSSIVQVTSR